MIKKKRTVWTKASVDSIYEPRCSVCGKYKKSLFFHWFFTGLYCIACIQGILYDDARTMEEMK